ncbi:MAG: hypothetical protein AAF401_15425 [Pseudomonadota bacterium]
MLAVLRDLGRWMLEVEALLAPDRPPQKAIAMVGETPTLMAWNGADYAASGPASAGERAPVLLLSDQALTSEVSTVGEAALYGEASARIEVAKASPFPLETTKVAISPTGRAWANGGSCWRFALIPTDRLAQISAKLQAHKTRNADVFAMANGAPVWVEKRRSRLAPAMVILTLVAMIAAAISVELGSRDIETNAKERLAIARSQLSQAEAEAEAAAQRRDALASPLRSANAAASALKAVPPAGDLLEVLTAATPDAAHAQRVSIAGLNISLDVISEDAAALARSYTDVEGLAAASLKGAARVDAGSGLQRATIEALAETEP